MRFDYRGYRVGVELWGGQWRAWVKRLTRGAYRTVVSGYETEHETVEAVKRWIERGTKGGMR